MHNFKKLNVLGLLLLSNLLGVHEGLAQSTKLFQQGNRLMAQKQFTEAVGTFEQAAKEKPNSAEILFNLGHAYYRTESFEQASSRFEQAASATESDDMRSQCWYNVANCMTKLAVHFQELDAASSIEYYRRAAWLYRTALSYKSDFSDAAFNLEVVQQRAVLMEEKIKEEHEKQEQENELIKYIREKLQQFIEQQTHLIQLKNVGPLQQDLEKETRALVQVIAHSGLHKTFTMPDDSEIPGPLKETHTHTLNAANAMALPDPPTALAELIAALGAAPEDPNKQEGDSNEDSGEADDADANYEESEQESEMYEDADPFGDFSEYEEIRGVPPPHQNEMDILAEEALNQTKRKKKKAGEYKAVEKDW